MQGVGRPSGLDAPVAWTLQPPAFEGGKFPLDERQDFLMRPKH